VIYHIARAADWEAAAAAGEYRVSTLGRTLEQEGFVHASFAEQVGGVAEAYYAGVPEPLVLLSIDESRLSSPWRVEPVPGVPEGYPHVYGPIDADAVLSVTPLTRDGNGHLVLPAL
jgi:glutathione S-transferase